MTSGRCEACDVAVAESRVLCLDCERQLSQGHIDALNEAAAVLRCAQRDAVEYVKKLPPLPCAEDGCERPRARGRRYCFGHNGTGPRGVPAWGVGDI